MNLMDLFIKIGVDDQASSKVSSISSKLGNGLKTAAKIGVAAVTAASTAVVAFGKSAVDAGSTFDKSMSQVAATMGKTVEEIKELRDFAQEMGRTTAFSASQAADALNYMALAGYDAKTSMRMLPNVLNLAAAGNIELAAASDMVTDAQSALGLTLDQTSEMVDKMAKASSKSNTSVEQLGNAFLTVGGTAKNLKGGTTELSTALGILADNGVKGSEGGTALRNILLSLNPTTEDAVLAFNNLNVSAYDAQGKMRNLKDVFADLNKSMEGMSDQEKQTLLSDMFNKVDLKSVNALLATTSDRWDELTEAIDNSAGAAQKMADTQLDNLQGDITLFKSALEGAQIAVSDKLTPSLRKFVQFGSDGLSKLTEAFKSKGFEGAVDVFGEILSDGLSAIIEGLPKVLNAGSRILETLMDGILSNSDKIFDAIYKAILILTNTAIKLLPKIIQLGLDLVIALAKGISENTATLIPAVVSAITEIANVLSNPENLSLLLDAALKIVLAIAEGIVDNIDEMIDAAFSVIDNLIEFLMMPENVKKLIKAAGKLIVALGEGFIKYRIEAAKGFAKVIESIAENVKNLGKSAITWGKDLIDNFVSGIKQKISKVTDAVKGIANTVKDFIGFSEPKKGPLSNFHTYAPDMIDLFTNGIRDNEHKLTEQISKSFDFGDATIGANVYGSYSGSGYSAGGTSFGTVNINIDGANVQDDATLADMIAERLQRMTERRGAVFA